MVSTKRAFVPMKFLAAYLLMFTFLALGTGGLEYLHNLQHAAEDARADAMAAASGQSHQDHHHDETNCSMHAQLHIALFLFRTLPPLLGIGALLAILKLRLQHSIPLILLHRIDCRGPPALLPA
jgi:hypothetical protein